MLINESESKSDNHWRLDFRQGLFNTTSHSSLSRTAAQLADAFDGAEDLDQPYHSNPLCVSRAWHGANGMPLAAADFPADAPWRKRAQNQRRITFSGSLE